MYHQIHVTYPTNINSNFSSTTNNYNTEAITSTSSSSLSSSTSFNHFSNIEFNYNNNNNSTCKATTSLINNINTNISDNNQLVEPGLAEKNYNYKTNMFSIQQPDEFQQEQHKSYYYHQSNHQKQQQFQLQQQQHQTQQQAYIDNNKKLNQILVANYGYNNSANTLYNAAYQQEQSYFIKQEPQLSYSSYDHSSDLVKSSPAATYCTLKKQKFNTTQEFDYQNYNYNQLDNSFGNSYNRAQFGNQLYANETVPMDYALMLNKNDEKINKAFGIAKDTNGNCFTSSNAKMEKSDVDEITAHINSRERNDSCSKASDDSDPFRNGATLRERNRMHILNDAFDDLRKIVPKTNLNNEHQRLSKIATLRLAIHYISALTRLLQSTGGCKPVDPSLLPAPPRRRRRRKFPKVNPNANDSTNAPGQNNAANVTNVTDNNINTNSNLKIKKSNNVKIEKAEVETPKAAKSN